MTTHRALLAGTPIALLAACAGLVCARRLRAQRTARAAESAQSAARAEAVAQAKQGQEIAIFTGLMAFLRDSGQWRHLPDQQHMQADLALAEALAADEADDQATAAKCARYGLEILSSVMELDIVRLGGE